MQPGEQVGVDGLGPGGRHAVREAAEHGNPGLHRDCTPGTFRFLPGRLAFSNQKGAQADHGGGQGRDMTGIDINKAAR